MEETNLYVVAITLFMVLLWLFINPSKEKKHKNKLPSPPSLPIIGHFHILDKDKPFPRALEELSFKYGPIFSLKLGRIPILVVSSPSLVEECLTIHDIVLANRPNNISAKHFHYDSTTLGAAPYGPLWRNLRKVTAVEFFSTTRVNLFRHVREDETRLLIKELLLNNQSTKQFVQVEMRPKLFQCSFNIVMMMLTGKRYVFEGADQVLYDIMKEFFELSGASNPIDFFPFLRWFNFGNIEGKMILVMQKMDAFLDGVLQECKKLRGVHVKPADSISMIYKLFDLQDSDPKQYSDQTIKGIIMIMLIAAIDTSVITIEWALALLLNHQNILHKAQSEIDNCIGRDRLVDESDLDKLHFIHSVINETLRLFPAAPLLIPHSASKDCSIAGYPVRKDTMVLINVWALHRDPNLWDDHLTFKPERFEGDKVNEYQSSFIPFGLGRRSCPGGSLAKRFTTLILATLIQCFDWENVNGVNVDLTEASGLTMPMATPLVAMCKARQDTINMVSNL